MGADDRLAVEFERERRRLRRLAYRMLGSVSDADDAVQDVWLRPTQASSRHRGPAHRLPAPGSCA